MHLRPIGLGEVGVTVCLDAVLRVIDDLRFGVVAKVMARCKGDLIFLDPAEQLDAVVNATDRPAFWDWRSQGRHGEDERDEGEDVELHLEWMI